MGGFTNSVVGGTTLVRPAIQSPNYVAGVSGWTINRDGSAEFNNLTVRGTIVLSPTPNNGLYLNSLRWNDGFATPGAIWEDATNGDRLNIQGPHAAGVGGMLIAILPGNANPNDAHIQLQGQPNDPLNVNINALGTRGIDIARDASGVTSKTDIGGSDSGPVNLWGATTVFNQMTIDGASGSIVFNPGAKVGGTAEFLATAALKLDQGATFQLGAGLSGKYYYEDYFAPGTQAIATGSLVTLTNWVLGSQNTDYGTAFNATTGTWTCPATGIYAITFYCEYTAGVTTRFVVAIVDISVPRNEAQFDATSTGAGASASFVGKINAGEQIQLRTLQSSGAAKTVGINTRVSFYKCL